MTATTEETVAPPVTVQLSADDLAKAFAEAMRTLPAPQGPVAQPLPPAVVREEPPYRFDGIGGSHGFVADAYDSFNGSAEATQRLEKFLHETFAVATTNVTAVNPPPTRPDMFVNSLRWNSSPLADAISTGSIADATPFVVPKFSSATNLVAPHVEGVEPALAGFTATSQTITPGAVSGKAEINREVWDARGNPQVDQMVWDEMVNAHVEAKEARVAALLDGLTPTAIPVVGVDAAAVDDVVAALIALQYEKGGNRFNSLVASQNLYTALSAAKDTTGRKLLPTINPVNADGNRAADFGTLLVGNVTVVPAWGLGTSSYLLVKGSTWQWSSPPQKLTFDVQVKSIYLGLFAYAAEANIRLADVREITYAAS